MLFPKSGVIATLAIVFLKIDVTLSQQPSCGNSTKTLERGKREVISCEYAMDFIAVFWYRGQESNPFLRLEGGSPTTEEGFDIDMSGNMIIQNVDVSHEGAYRISVVDSNGNTGSATINIFVIVWLKRDPQLESCATSQNVFCQEISEEQKASYLVCSTADTRPLVDFVWSKLSPNGPVEEHELRSNSSMNSTTRLFVSFSVFKFDATVFSLQYFTCSASGPAVLDKQETSFFVEGDKDVEQTLTSTVNVFQGKSLQISCSDDPFELSTWIVTYTNNTVRILKEFYPGQKSGPCLLTSGCYVNEDGALSIESITYQSEGTYACTYGTGDTAEKQLTQVSVIIKPNPEKIVIEGCADVNECDKSVALTGTLHAYITGARPFVEVKCVIMEGTESQGFIFDDKNEVSPPQKGTFDTKYTVGYEIEECSEPVPIVCKVQEDSVFTTLSSSRVNLVTDPSNCRKRPGLVVFIVLVMIILVGVLIAFIIYKRKKKKVQKGGLVKSYSPSKESLKLAQNDVAENLLERDEERGEGEGGSVGQETKSDNESQQPLYSNELMSVFQIFCKDLKEKKAVPKEHFENLMNMFQEYDREESPSTLLVNQMLKDNCEYEMLSVVIQYLVNLTPSLEFKHWVPILDFCKLLEELTSTNKLPSGISLTHFVTIFKNKQMSLTMYVDVTGKLFKSGTFDETTLMSNLKDLFSKQRISQEELVDSVLQYMISFKLNKKKVLEEVKELENEVPHLLYLRQARMFYKSGSREEILFDFFDDILKETLSSQSLKVIHHGGSDEEKAIPCIYVQVLLFGTIEGKISLEKAAEMLKSGLDKEGVFLSEFKVAFEKSVSNEKVTKELKRDLAKVYFRLLKKVLPHGDFEDESSYMINSEQFENMFWIEFIVELWREGTVNDDTKEKLILQVADAYGISREDFKEKLDVLMGKDERRTFHKSIQFKDGDNKKIKDKEK